MQKPPAQDVDVERARLLTPSPGGGVELRAVGAPARAGDAPAAGGPRRRVALDKGAKRISVHLPDADADPGAEADLTGDYGNIALLLLLYTLQGVPMGLTAAVGLSLQTQGASLASLNLFGQVSWPFSLKILWAPVVDSLYVKTFGLRKTWPGQAGRAPPGRPDASE